MSHVTAQFDRDPKWDSLFEAQHQLFIAARHTLQAMTLQGDGRYTGSHERFALEAMTAAAKALGYDLVRTPAPDAVDRTLDRINAAALGVRS